MKKLLVEKYRPVDISTYVFNDESTKQKVTKWINEGEVPNILLSGGAGTGKSTLAKVLINELGIDQSDCLIVNASLDNGIGFIREVIEPWTKRSSFSKFKVIVCEECDQLGSFSQKSLRQIIEDTSNYVRWIFTCNYPEKVIPALHSRLQNIHINDHDYDGVLNLILDIIEAEDIMVDGDDDDILSHIVSHIDAYYPDIRKIINSIDEHTDENKNLRRLSQKASGGDSEDWVSMWATDDKIDLSKAISLTETIDLNNYETFYEAVYENSHKLPSEAHGLVLLSRYLDRAQKAANQRLHLKAFLYHVFVVDVDDE